MSYTLTNYPTKKALKEAVANGDDGVHLQRESLGQKPNMNGIAYVEGPHFPQPHKWYARVQIKDGKIVKVLS